MVIAISCRRTRTFETRSRPGTASGLQAVHRVLPGIRRNRAKPTQAIENMVDDAGSGTELVSADTETLSMTGPQAQ